MVLSGRIILSTIGGNLFPEKKTYRLCSDSKFQLPNKLIRYLNNILALLLHRPASDNIASTCTASFFVLVSTANPFPSGASWNCTKKGIDDTTFLWKTLCHTCECCSMTDRKVRNRADCFSEWTQLYYLCISQFLVLCYSIEIPYRRQENVKIENWFQVISQ